MLSITRIDFSIKQSDILFLFLFIFIYQAQANEPPKIAIIKNAPPQLYRSSDNSISNVSQVIAKATSLPPLKLQNLTQQYTKLSTSSDLIFHGQVVDVQYMAAETNTSVNYPLTYITFSIIETLQGNFTENEIVLMVPGMGLTKTNKFALIKNRPIFATDDELIIFLSEGTLNGPKFIHHLFVIDGVLYDDQSHEIIKGENNEILRGELVFQSKIFERPLGVGTFKLIREHSDISASSREFNQSNNSIQPQNSGYSKLNVFDFKDLLQKNKAPSKTSNKLPLKKGQTKTIKSANAILPLFFSKKTGLSRGKK